MAWSRQEQDRVYELTRAVQCGKDNGTAFPIHATACGVWYVTCDHVLRSAAQAADVLVHGTPAIALWRGQDFDLDLALFKLPPPASAPGAHASACLALAQRFEPARECYVPGCYITSGDRKVVLREGVQATLTGARADVALELAAAQMKAWSLEIGGEDRLEKGYSGAPVVCTHTGRVFAVAAFRKDYGKGGIALCISNLAPLLRDAELAAELAGLLPPPAAQELARELHALMPDPATRFDLEAAWSVVLRSAPRQAALGEMPADPASFCDWLLNRAPWSAAPGTPPRDALHDVLLWLEQHARGDEAVTARIRRCRELRRDDYPDVTTGPLPEPAAAGQGSDAPHLIEVVLDPLPNASETGYSVHSHFHPGDGSQPEGGPVRDRGHGHRLDPRDPSQALALVMALTRRRVALGLDASRCIFQFRVPLELLLHAFERWPKNALKQALGHEYAVVLAASDDERDWSACEGHWSPVQAAPGAPLRQLACCVAIAPDRELTDDALDALARDLAQTPCLLLEAPPPHPHPERLSHLKVIAVIGVLALWPRSSGVGGGLCRRLLAQLGDTPLHRLPFVLRDLRRDGAAEPALADLALFWDDPGRSARRPGAPDFHPGFGTLGEPPAATPATPITAETPA